MPSVTTFEPCPECRTPAACAHQLDAHGQQQHIWTCPVCGSDSFIVGYLCPHCPRPFLVGDLVTWTATAMRGRVLSLTSHTGTIHELTPTGARVRTRRGAHLRLVAYYSLRHADQPNQLTEFAEQVFAAHRRTP